MVENDTGRTMPTSIAEVMNVGDVGDVGAVGAVGAEFTIENIYTYAGEALEFLKIKKNKTSITASDTLTYFYNFDTSSNNRLLLKQLFCLSVSMLFKNKDSLNEINESTYEKLITYTVRMYISKKAAMS